MKPLPIGIQHFDKLREGGYLYIDKTKFAYQLANLGGSFFLARPRRFGKSLFLSTLEQLSLGRKDLFEGLWIEDKWDWTRKYAVIRISFLEVSYDKEGLEKGILDYLKTTLKERGFDPLPTDDIKLLFQQLIKALHESVGKVVLLIDEYDKPIIDYLEHDKLETAKKNQGVMKMFYSTLKDYGQYLHLLFITGISKFSKVSLFSDLNHLSDLTLTEQVADCFGYTQEEVEDSFDEYLQIYQDKYQKASRKEVLDLVREWYNGYSWDGIHKVYNPFGLLSFLQNSQLRNYWFDTGTPTFLLKMLIGREEYEFENYKTSASFMNQYSLDNIQTASLLFQTGYLTVIERDEYDNLVLDYPNREVRDSFYQFLMTYLGQRNRDSKITVQELSQAFSRNDMEEAQYLIQSVFDALPYDIYTNNNESLYQGMVHILFHYLGLNIESEVHTKRGRLDAVVQTPTHVYIFEFKLNKSSEEAMEQIKNRDYASKYRSSGKKIIGIGLNFRQDARQFDVWKMEAL